MIRTLLLTATAALCFSSCTTSNSTAPARAQFLKDVWVAPKMKNVRIASRFDSVFVAPVHTALLEQQSWWKSQNTRIQDGELRSDALQLAYQFRRRLATEVLAWPGNTLKLAGGPGPGVLVLEIAITELVPSKAYWNAASTAAGFVVPGAGLLSAAGSGSIAIEGRVRDGGSGEVLAVFADRRSDPISPVNLRSYKWYGGAEKNLDSWAHSFAAAMHAEPGQVVSRPSRFTLKPW